MNMPVLLIVDDEKPTRDALRMGFQDDYEVYTASNPLPGRHPHAGGISDLVLTDPEAGRKTAWTCSNPPPPCPILPKAS